MIAREGYTLGAGEGEADRIEVCEHRQPLGWTCVGCNKGYGTAPARPAKPARFIVRAVCNHCGVRSWLDEVPK